MRGQHRTHRPREHGAITYSERSRRARHAGRCARRSYCALRGAAAGRGGDGRAWRTWKRAEAHGRRWKTVETGARPTRLGAGSAGPEIAALQHRHFLLRASHLPSSLFHSASPSAPATTPNQPPALRPPVPAFAPRVPAARNPCPGCRFVEPEPRDEKPFLAPPTLDKASSETRFFLDVVSA